MTWTGASTNDTALPGPGWTVAGVGGVCGQNVQCEADLADVHGISGPDYYKQSLLAIDLVGGRDAQAVALENMRCTPHIYSSRLECL